MPFSVGYTGTAEKFFAVPAADLWCAFGSAHAGKTPGLFGAVNFKYQSENGMKADSDTGGMAMSQVLNVKNLTQRFGGLVALNMWICVNEERLLGITDPMVAGKSTLLLQPVSPVSNPTEGSGDGKRYTGMETIKLRDGPGFQNLSKYKTFRRMTRPDNVLIGMHTRTKTNLLTLFTRAKKGWRNVKKAVDLLRTLNCTKI